MMDRRARLKEKAWETVHRCEPVMRELALRILSHPELGYAELEACRWLAEPMEQEGFVVDRPLGGLPTAFQACHGPKTGPTVAFLAEYDALPGVGHGCGHNLIGPAAVGAALGVAAVLPQSGGRVCVIGTPAEEFLGQVEGKIRLLEAGAFDELDVALMMHPHYEFRLPGGDLGFIACELHFHGRPAHAAVDPWHGANALDGLLLTFNNINALRQHLRPEIRVHGVVTDGGQAPNVIPERASARLMVRAPNPEQLEAVYRRVEDCACAGALASDTRLEVVRVTTVYNSVGNPTLNGLIAANLALLGENVNPDPLDMSASSDFGNISQLLPAAMFWAGTHPLGIPWHSAEVARASGEEMALRGMVVSACALAGVAVDLLADRALLEKVRADFVAAGG